MTTQTTPQQQLTRDTIDIPYRHVTTHFIDGAWQEGQGDEIIEVVDPATNTVWGSVPVGTRADVNAAVDAAHDEIGRASCRESVQSWEGAVAVRENGGAREGPHRT